MSKQIDPAFLALKPEALAERALQAAAAAGATYADFRLERVRAQNISLHDLALENVLDDTEIGLCVRVIADGTWGFAASTSLSAESAEAVAKRAVAVAKESAKLSSEPVELADVPVHQGSHVSSYLINPFEVALTEKIELLNGLSKPLAAAKNVDHVDFRVQQVMENKYFASLSGTRTNQQRVRILGQCTATSVDRKTGNFEKIRTCSLPEGRGWEYFTGGYDFAGELAQIPQWLAEKIEAPSVKPGAYDLIIDPSNLWLTIHESIGHATELDRALGYEANYAGTSFATTDKLDKLQYGSKLMHITGDRTVEHGLATIGYDDEGVAAQRWDIVRDGILRGYQLNRQMAAKFGWRSNGCTFADSYSHIPLQRMPNVSLQPARDDTTLEDLIGGVDNGIYIVGDNSWSIDMQRYNFQFTGQRFYAVKNGKLTGQLRDVAYQSNTLTFWNSLDGLGGPATYRLGGAMNCGKGQPGQVAAVSHGAPVARFRGVNVLNTTQEGSS
jgi:TldD protein